MKKLVTTFAALLLLGAAPTMAAGFGLFASYYDAGDADSTGGGGIDLSFPLTQSLDLQLRGSYYEELNDDGFDALFDDDRTVFSRGSLEVIPIEAGVKWNFVPGGTVSPYLGGGATYFLLDHDNENIEVDDETGFYAQIGARFGQPRGINFFVEGLYRSTEATLNLDPDEVDDFDDIELEDEVALDLDGPVVNAGVVWTF